jgi:YHS domain-containing protein
LGQRPGFIPEHQALVAPWSQPLQAAWLVGPSRHGSEAEHGRDDRAHGATATTAIDPACGMTIKIDLARAAGLHAQHEGTDYYFCGRGCLLDFGEDPQHFLAAGYLPSM